MPQITSIKPQKSPRSRSKSGHITRFNIYIDDKFAFGLDEKVIAEQKLKVGTKLTNDQIEIILKSETTSRLFDASLKFLQLRSRSEKEIKDYLSKKIAKEENIKFAEAAQSPIIPIVLKKLHRYNYVNDREFAIWWVKSRIKRAKGPRLIRFELLQKGIDKEIIEKALAASPAPQKAAVLALEKKLKSWQNLSQIEFKKKVVNFLASRGFNWETIEEIFAFLQKKR